jgi:RNA polymerase sigma-70 factor (ECF subfamily)
MFTLAFPLNPFQNLWNLWLQRVSYLLERTLVFFASPAAPTVSREEDALLIKEALSGDPGFEKLVRAYEQLVYRVAFRFLGDPTDASDVAQEVFLRVHKALPKFRGDSALSTWIYAITANLSRNAIRSRKNREKVQVLAPKERDEDKRNFWDRMADKGAISSSRKLESRELNDAIQSALAELPPDYKEAVILRDMEDLDYSEIAQVLKTNSGTVKSRIARGRALLRERLKDWI